MLRAHAAAPCYVSSGDKTRQCSTDNILSDELNGLSVQAAARCTKIRSQCNIPISGKPLVPEVPDIAEFTAMLWWCREGSMHHRTPDATDNVAY
jgi:hypothetical protein